MLVSIIISAITIAVGIASAVYWPLFIARRPRLTLPRRRMAWQNFSFALFMACFGALTLLGQHWPPVARWTVDAVAGVIVAARFTPIARGIVRARRT